MSLSGRSASGGRWLVPFRFSSLNYPSPRYERITSRASGRDDKNGDVLCPQVRTSTALPLTWCLLFIPREGRAARVPPPPSHSTLLLSFLFHSVFRGFRSSPLVRQESAHPSALSPLPSPFPFDPCPTQDGQHLRASLDARGALSRRRERGSFLPSPRRGGQR